MTDRETYTMDELQSILDLHRKWLYIEEGGRRAYLSGAYLSGADLSRADLSGADLSRAKNAELAMAMTVVVPEGEIIGWKKAMMASPSKVCERGRKIVYGRALVKLRIPADAARSNASGRKCRASKAEVLDIEPLCSAPEGAICCSMHDMGFEYSVGDTAKPREPFDPDRWNECASGIHFFITREEALAW